MALKVCVASKACAVGSVHATACARLHCLAVAMKDIQVHADRAADVW